MNNLAQRAITSVIGASVLIFAMVWNEYSLIALLYMISFLVHFEYLRTVQKFKSGGVRIFEYVLNLLVAAALFAIPLYSMNQLYSSVYSVHLSIIISGITGLIFSVFLYDLFSNRENPFQNISMNITGIIYCVLPFILLFQCTKIIEFKMNTPGLHYSPEIHPYYFVLGYFLIVWTNDVMAYFTGRAIGKHKLFERISPKKTWEGFFGGFIFSIGAAILISWYLFFLTTIDWIIIAIIISVFGTLGDLVESMLKRSLQVKDSSNILPGHGGFLDRFDATLIAAPFVYLYLQFPMNFIDHGLH